SRLAEEQGDVELKGEALFLKGASFYALSDHPQAIKALEESLHMSKEIGDMSLEESCLSVLGSVYWRQGDYSRALRDYRQGLEIARDQNAKGNIGRHLGNIGLVYQSLGYYAEAITHYRQAVEIAKDPANSDRGSAITFLVNLGGVYTDVGKFDEARVWFEEAEQLAAKDPRLPTHEYRVVAGMAKLYFRQGRYQEASKVVEQALRLARDSQDLVKEGAGLNELGALHLNLSETDKSIEAHQLALSAGEKAQIPQIIWQAHAGLASAYQRLGKFDPARDHYRKAIEAMESVWAKLGIGEDKASFLQNQVEIYKNFAGFLVSHAEKAMAKENEAEAFHYAERARARALLDLLAKSRVDLDKEIDADLRAWRQDIQKRISETQSELRRAASQKSP